MFKNLVFVLLFALPLAVQAGPKTAPKPVVSEKKAKIEKTKTELAIFAGGCFWCMQPPYDNLKDKGVISVTAGYTGGSKEKPTYKEVSAGGTGHREAIEVVFDPAKIAYEDIVAVYWHQIDPFDATGQFCDKGEQYTSAIFYTSPEQKRIAEAYRDGLAEKTKSMGTLATEVLPAKEFYPAEEYHQSYYKKNPLRYKFYRFNCGRDKRLKEIWGASEH